MFVWGPALLHCQCNVLLESMRERWTCVNDDPPNASLGALDSTPIVTEVGGNGIKGEHYFKYRSRKGAKLVPFRKTNADGVSIHTLARPSMHVSWSIRLRVFIRTLALSQAHRTMD
jgi:hypothetical protein